MGKKSDEAYAAQRKPGRKEIDPSYTAEQDKRQRRKARQLQQQAETAGTGEPEHPGFRTPGQRSLVEGEQQGD